MYSRGDKKILEIQYGMERQKPAVVGESWGGAGEGTRTTCQTLKTPLFLDPAERKRMSLYEKDQHYGCSSS